MTKLHAALRSAMLIASIAVAPCVHAHDSWFTPDLRMVTGNRYPVADLGVPAENVVASACSEGTCWAELTELEVELDAKRVDVYFNEAKPPDSVRARWRDSLANGAPWRERYRKFLRAGTGMTPAGLDLEIVAANAPVHSGAAARFRLLAQGSPVPHQPVELVSDRSPIGIWSRTNERGEVEWTLPFRARWLVRTIVIEPGAGSKWRSRFATLVFDAR
ncbi:DUF4198 domain-containing protein [Ramlibacter sp.]|uniref:DUF4198 domain-containing protein n=1 Tax=Ramlibacter sp. TaxID=1917967 RepID=UPI002C56B029|nr:DUF4198 domain-containing protein [Ramlibacter sp.]HWI80684.1 DUF4198 domain-containing protein [Ramlibacter sp.]